MQGKQSLFPFSVSPLVFLRKNPADRGSLAISKHNYMTYYNTVHEIVAMFPFHFTGKTKYLSFLCLSSGLPKKIIIKNPADRGSLAISKHIYDIIMLCMRLWLCSLSISQGKLSFLCLSSGFPQKVIKKILLIEAL